MNTDQKDNEKKATYTSIYNQVKGIQRQNDKYYRLKDKLRKMFLLEKEIYFVTATLNSKGGKDRNSAKTIKTAMANAIKKAQIQYYVYVIEQHKKGGWHAHGYIAEKEKEFKKAYKSGFTKIEKVNSYANNELTKYLTKQNQNTRSMFASQSLNAVIKYKRKEYSKNKENQNTKIILENGIVYHNNNKLKNKTEWLERMRKLNDN